MDKLVQSMHQGQQLSLHTAVPPLIQFQHLSPGCKEPLTLLSLLVQEEADEDADGGEGCRLRQEGEPHHQQQDLDGAGQEEGAAGGEG